MIKPHHPQNRFERIKLREKKEQKKFERDPAGHVRKRVAVEEYKAEEARHEIEQFSTRTTIDGSP